jgi:hypothetical protein
VNAIARSVQPGVGVVADQGPGHLQRRAVRIHAGAALGEQGGEPVPLGVGPLAELAQVDRQALGAAHDRGQRGRAKRGIGGPLGGGPLDVRHQPRVRGERGAPDRLVGVLRDARGQAADPVDERGRDRRAEPVERVQGRVDGVRPGGQVPRPGLRPLGGRGVLPVVAGQIQVAQVQDRVAPVHLQVAEEDPGRVLRRGQMRLVVRVIEPRAAGRRLGQAGQPGPDPVG